MALGSIYYNHTTNRAEQRLIEDLVTDSIKIYGLEVGYLGKTIVANDELYTEDEEAEFTEVTDCVMYIKSVDGFEGEGDFLSKFGLEIRDQITFCVARRHFAQSVEQEQSIFRPREGDLIFLPLNEKIFQIMFVEHEPTFYQMGGLTFYELRCELFEYSNERFNTNIDVIDQIQTTHSLDIYSEVEMTDENDNPIFTEDGYRVLSEEEDRVDASSDTARDFDTITNSENVFLETQGDAIIDFSESDPFSEGNL